MSDGAPNAWAMWALVAAIAFILMIAVIFAMLAVTLRILKGRRDARELYLRKLWMGPVLDCIVDPRTHAFRHGIRHRDQLLFLEFLGRMALSLSAQELGAIRSIARPYIRVANVLLSDREPEFRALGVQLLGLLDPVSNRQHLVAALSDRSPLVSLTAIRSLSRTDAEQDVLQIIEVLPRFEGWGTSMLTSLLVSCGTRATGPLRRLCQDQTAGVRIRVAACDALRWLVDVLSVEVSTEILLSEPNREIGAACLRLIGRLGLEKDIALLTKYTTHDDWILRLYAVSGVAGLASPQHGEQIALSIGDPSDWVAMRAARGLSQIGRQDLLQHIVDINHPRAALARQHLTREAA